MNVGSCFIDRVDEKFYKSIDLNVVVRVIGDFERVIEEDVS